jgi:hypothetical protein
MVYASQFSWAFSPAWASPGFDRLNFSRPNSLGLIPRGLPRIRHTGGSRYPENQIGFPRIKHGQVQSCME